MAVIHEEEYDFLLNTDDELMLVFYGLDSEPKNPSLALHQREYVLLTRAADEPPADTRAWLRAALVRRYPEQTVAASWSRLTVRDASLPSGLRTLDCADPLAHTRDRCEQAVEESCDAAGLFGALCADTGNTR